MRLFRSVCLLMLCSWAVPTAASAQLLPLPGIPLSVEVRAGAGIPTGEFAEPDTGVGAESGLALAAGATLQLGSVVGAYAEYQRTAFGCSRCAARGIDDEVVADGGGFGIHATLAGPLGTLGPWLRAGAVLQQLTFTGRGSSLSSDVGAGFEAGGGLSFGVLPMLSITPGVRYRAFSAVLDLGGLQSQTVDVTQIVAELGLSLRF